MNKFGFISSILTLVLFFFEFIPLGLIIGAQGNISMWLLNLFGINSNPWVGAYATFPLEFFNNGTVRIFLWGIISDGSITLWHEIHLISFIFLFCLSLSKGFITLIGSVKETTGGKKIMIFNFITLIIILTYIIIGIPFFSSEILGTNVNIFYILDYLEIAFLLLLFDLLFSYYALNHHPIKEA